MTDEMIMEAVKNGDLQQASMLFERYNKRIFNFLARLAMDRALAEDLTQNVFLRIIKYRGSYKEGARFQSWIYQVARNVFSDHYQAHKNKYSDFVDVEKLRDNMPEPEDEPWEEKEKLLHRSMAMLPDEQRELLVLTRFQHMKYEEVAQIMNTTVANIKVKVHRAVAKLREHYFELEKN
ncbi:RNA polymerase sigma-70 factor, ECF subfamily [Chryseolinea serpens]|jgi:RNA polymerase sigma-70 factor (ECF subfamily)|uniref:RNA polymerase sigma factor n=1 Tax=Chryseolinea serpens TaxID=947013 RepID=A0A1M5WWE5_9BACT|nr:sigma-70 family RNA polymerase sigma factor [Chryseolinea serpens]SHH91638.1 RNA polymerase sigma-70 factor, ECF subfamily [Chryseolinea serpens]